MKTHKALAGLACATAFFAGFSPTYANANEAPVCSGSYVDHQTDMYADVGFYVDDFCYDPDGDPLTISSVGWGPGWQYVNGANAALLWQIALGQETVPITVTDGQGGVTVFDWVVYRPGN